MSPVDFYGYGSAAPIGDRPAGLSPDQVVVTLGMERRQRCGLAVMALLYPGWAAVPFDRLEQTDIWRKALAVADAVCLEMTR